MGANTTNALFYLVSTLFEVYVWIVMLRILLQMVRADFYNPISQLIWLAGQGALFNHRFGKLNWLILDLTTLRFVANPLAREARLGRIWCWQKPMHLLQQLPCRKPPAGCFWPVMCRRAFKFDHLCALNFDQA